MSRTYRTLFASLLGMAMLALSSQMAMAQNAALQARANMQQQHQQSSSIGAGYRQWSTGTHQQSARTPTQSLSA